MDDNLAFHWGQSSEPKGGQTKAPNNNLFGGVSLVREWGRLGNPGRLRCDHHDDPGTAEAALKALRRRKLSRGYREVA